MRHITMLGLAVSVLMTGLAAQTPPQTPAQAPTPVPKLGWVKPSCWFNVPTKLLNPVPNPVLNPVGAVPKVDTG